MFNLDIVSARRDMIREIIEYLNTEFSTILKMLEVNLVRSKTETDLPQDWADDVIAHLNFTVNDVASQDLIYGAIGVFDTEDGENIELPKDVLWKAMIINYGMGLFTDMSNEFLSEYMSGEDFSTSRLATGLNIATRYDRYYDPDKKAYVEPNPNRKNMSLPQFSHHGTTWWSDVYEKFLDALIIADGIVRDISERISNLDWDSYLTIDKYLTFNL